MCPLPFQGAPSALKLVSIACLLLVWPCCAQAPPPPTTEAPVNNTIVVVPLSMSETVFTSANPVGRRVTATFPTSGENMLDLTLVAWQRFVTFETSSADGAVLPYGFSGYRRLICPGTSCVSAVNSTLVFDFGRAPDFDVYVSQYVSIVLGQRLTPRRATQLRLTIEIVPKPTAAPPDTYFLSAVAIAAHVVSAFALPATMDTSPLLLSTQVTCARAEERHWMPAALYAVLPFGGDTLFERSWRLGAFLAAVYAAMLLLIKFHTHAMIDANRAGRVREMLPFVGGQIVLFLAPGLAFASGSMMTSPQPTFQVLGAVVAMVLLLCLYALHGWLYRADEWVYDRARPPRLPPTASVTERLKRFLTVRGHWFNDETPFRVTKIMPREVRGDGNHLKVLVLWGVNVGLCVSAGLAPPNPIACIAQGACVGTAYVLTAIGVLKFRPFRSPVLNYASAWVRLQAGGAFGLMSLQQDDSKWVLFVLLASATLIVVIPRSVYALTMFRKATSDAVHRRQQDRERALLEAPSLDAATKKDNNDEHGAKVKADEEEELMAEAERGGNLFESVAMARSTTIAPEEESSPTDAPMRGAGRSGTTFEGMNASFANASMFSVMGDPSEPRYIREASRVKPRVPLEADRLEVTPVWLPSGRPHVRMHNEPDLPLPAAFEPQPKA